MASLLRVLDPILLASLAGTTLVLLADFLRGPGGRLAIARNLLGGTLLCAALRLGLFVAVYGRPPLATPGEAFSTIAFSITLVTFLLEVIDRERSTAFLMLAAATMFQGVSLLGEPVGSEVNALLHEPWFGMHAVTAILGYTAFAIGAVYGVVFLLLYADLKRRRFGVVYEQAPSLEELSRTAIRASTLGFVFLTAAFVVGVVGWRRVLDHPVHEDPKVVSTFLVWLVYGTGISLYWFAGWRGLRCVSITLAGFLLMILSSWLVPLALGSMHGVRGLL
ncbi:MAG: cytochrome c biogenesis protein CcsA [bacterium]